MIVISWRHFGSNFRRKKVRFFVNSLFEHLLFYFINILQAPFCTNIFVILLYTVKPAYNDHTRDPKIVAAVDRRSLFGGHLCYKRSNWDLKTVAVVVAIRRWSLAQV